MAVTIDVDDVIRAVRLDANDVTKAEVGRLLAVATELVELRAVDAPTVMQNEAAVRIVGYLYDAPTVSGGLSYASALRNSGAAGLLEPYRPKRAGAITGSDAAGDTPTPAPTPGGGGNVPEPPSGAGTYILQSVNGVLQWVRFPAPPQS